MHCSWYFFVLPITTDLERSVRTKRRSMRREEGLGSELRRKKSCGDGGYRSPYLSHAKRALYHLSYVPSGGIACAEQGIYRLEMGRAVTLAGMIWFLCVVQCVALDSSVGRAVDCSCDCQTSIGRWFKSGSREFFLSISLTGTMCGRCKGGGDTDSSIV